MTRRCVPKDTTPTLFALASDIASQLYSACAELYSLREFWLANRISLQGNALKYHFCDSENITLSKTAYHSKTIRKCALTHH